MSLNAVKILHLRDEQGKSFRAISEEMNIPLKEVVDHYVKAEKAKRKYDARDKNKVVYRKHHINKKVSVKSSDNMQQKLNKLVTKFGEKK